MIGQKSTYFEKKDVEGLDEDEGDVSKRGTVVNDEEAGSADDSGDVEAEEAPAPAAADEQLA